MDRLIGALSGEGLIVKTARRGRQLFELAARQFSMSNFLEMYPTYLELLVLVDVRGINLFAMHLRRESLTC